VWRLGPTYLPTPKGPRRLPSIIDQISGQHNRHVIPEDLAGAGNLLMFDNQGPEWTFYSSFISDARRLPNGNTFINEGMNGRFFQITPVGEIVWEYVSPYFGPQPLGPAGKKVQSNVVYRAQPVPYDWTPPGTRRGERALSPPDLAMFRVPAER